MENKKEKMHPFFKLLIVLFLIFIAFYISLESGYYPSRVEKKTIITKQNMEKFNNDINDNREIKSAGYLEKDTDYSNFVTKTGNKMTYSLGKIIEESIKGIKGTFKMLFW